MAFRKVFIPQKEGNNLVKSVYVEFEWFPGFSIKQKQKSIRSLHNEFNKSYDYNVLEVSTKSELEIGKKLSAFNLQFIKNGKMFCLESLFQGSKVFENSGPFNFIYGMSGKEAKKEIKEITKTSGNLIGFEYKNVRWPIYPKTAFYDWLYMRMLLENFDLVEKLKPYNAFTDIEFNEKKSINCQAHSLALFIALRSRGMLDVLNSKDEYINYISNQNSSESKDNGQFFFSNI